MACLRDTGDLDAVQQHFATQCGKVVKNARPKMSKGDGLPPGTASVHFVCALETGLVQQVFSKALLAIMKADIDDLGIAF